MTHTQARRILARRTPEPSRYQPVVTWRRGSTTISAGNSWVIVASEGHGALRLRTRDQLGALAKKIESALALSVLDKPYLGYVADGERRFSIGIVRGGGFTLAEPGLWENRLFTASDLADLASWLKGEGAMPAALIYLPSDSGPLTGDIASILSGRADRFARDTYRLESDGASLVTLELIGFSRWTMTRTELAKLGEGLAAGMVAG